MLPPGPTTLISKFGYLAVAGIIGLESLGLPLPGEATLIAAALYSGTGQQLNIWLVVASASLGAIVGDNIGFWLGRDFGFPALVRYGSYVGLNEGRMKVGQYLFWLHVGKIVFLGRFFCSFAALGCSSGRSQSDGLAEVPRVQYSWRDPLGYDLWVRRLLPRA